MKLQKLVCLGFSGDEFENVYWQELDSLTESRVLVSAEAEIGENTDADALLVKLGAKVTKDLIDQLPGLKYIGMLGTGYGGIDTTYATEKGITVTNIADYATEAVTEFTFGVLLEHLRNIANARTQAKDGDYSDDFSGSEVRGRKFGVIGLGNIGKRTAEVAKVLGADVYYWSKNRKDQADVKYLELDELLSTCDIVSLNVALNTETESLIDANRVGMIKKGCIFINPSPMELLDFDALLSRLKAGDITFILDHSDEMNNEQLTSFKPFDNCIIYPPIGYLTTEASELKKRIYVDNIKNFLNGNPTNKVT